jgi:hypothetical protein
MLFANKKSSCKEEIVELDALKLNASFVKLNRLFHSEKQTKRKTVKRSHATEGFTDSRNTVSPNGQSVVYKALADTKIQTSYSQKTTAISTEQTSPLDFYLSKKLLAVKPFLPSTRSIITQPKKCKGEDPYPSEILI